MVEIVIISYNIAGLLISDLHRPKLENLFKRLICRTFKISMLCRLSLFYV